MKHNHIVILFTPSDSNVVLVELLKVSLARPRKPSKQLAGY